ncbi:MAG: exodeoxyribonuclease III [Archangium gephyra]|uniref:Exodeoxyribonuclease III n=1 Tax=Archangium gephyra TaxID=48 RepID=A0A2W5SQR7_9BACT|nr:MAG: exodeoxyribonuclease III [Archangium gephyra]
MKIATWNINSVRARLERLVDYLKTRSPDVLCLQELKCTDEQFPHDDVKALGYHVETFGQKTYNGVAILSKAPIAHVARGMGDGDEQSRIIAGTTFGVRVVGVYAPNGQSLTSPAYEYKLEWYARLSRWLRTATRPLLVCGDFNVAPHDMDTWDPALWQGQVLASPKEREAFAAMNTHNALIDLFRAKHPEEGRFSWWDYRAGAFHKNQGLRIDHLLVTEDLVKRCTAVEIDRDARKGKQPSDHAPVWAEFA